MQLIFNVRMPREERNMLIYMYVCIPVCMNAYVYIHIFIYLRVHSSSLLAVRRLRLGARARGCSHAPIDLCARASRALLRDLPASSFSWGHERGGCWGQQERARARAGAKEGNEWFTYLALLVR